MPAPLVLRIALSRSCAGGEHGRCFGDAGGGVGCACLCHRPTDAGLEADAGGMLTEHLAQRGVVDALDRVAAYVDARWPGRHADVDLLDHLTRGLADEVSSAVATATAVLSEELAAVADRHAGELDLDGTLFVAVLLTGRGYFVALVAVDSNADRLAASEAVAAALSTNQAAYVQVYELDGRLEADPVLELHPTPPTLPAPAPDDTSPPAAATPPVAPPAGATE